MKNHAVIGRAFVVLMVASFMLTSAFAHHSFANFDMEHDTTLTGVVKEFKWTNPHAYVSITTADPAGTSTEWLVEFGASGGLSRRGWTRSSWKPGDTVKVVGHIARDGSKLMTFTRAFDINGQQYPPVNPAANR
jgi:hypothetical protein